MQSVAGGMVVTLVKIMTPATEANADYCTARQTAFFSSLSRPKKTYYISS